MILGRPLPALVISVVEREQLTTMTGSRSLPHALVRRAKIILLATAGLNNATSRANLLSAALPSASDAKGFWSAGLPDCMMS